jgi:hypothetical protein
MKYILKGFLLSVGVVLFCLAVQALGHIVKRWWTINTGGDMEVGMSALIIGAAVLAVWYMIGYAFTDTK